MTYFNCLINLFKFINKIAYYIKYVLFIKHIYVENNKYCFLVLSQTYIC